MTRDEALAEARRRWGPEGGSWESPTPTLLRYYLTAGVARIQQPNGTTYSRPYKIRIHRGKEWVGGDDGGWITENVMLGRGDSWESAFADADRRAREGRG